MLAGKTQKLANVAKKRPVLATLCCLLLVFSLAGFAFSTPADIQPEIMVLGSDVQTYDLDAVQWEFPLTLTGFGPGARTARLVEFSIDGHDLLQLVPEAQRTLTVHRLDNEISGNAFRKWDNYRRRAAILRVRNDKQLAFSESEERDYRELHGRVMRVGKRLQDISPSVFDSASLVLNVADLPFQVVADGHFKVRLAVKREQVQTVWEGEVLIADVEPLATNPIWTPAELHIHSTFAGDGHSTPTELAAKLSNRGYRISYVTDEPSSTTPTTMSGSGIRGQSTPLATWEQYRSAVLNASTVQVAMFPGAEIAASFEQPPVTSQHNGHALAYGIRNLTDLRYRWFLPNNLLRNININNINPDPPTVTNPNPPGPSSAALAHPFCWQYPWMVWGANLTERYNGYEVMSNAALQTNFATNSQHMNTWRIELVARFSNAFAGNGFPSVRTGSDYGNTLWGAPVGSMGFFTFIGIPSPLPSDMRNLLQRDVDRALLAGRTVASRLGGVASLRLRNAQGGLQEIGSWFTMPAGVMVGGDIVLRAAHSGNYRVRIIENSSGRVGVDDIRHDSSRHLNAGQTVTIPIGFRFVGGQRSYHVLVEHSSIGANDIIYTSPIFIRQ